MMIDNEAILHSDQGCHYTSMVCIRKLKDEALVQAMPRKGYCWDNAS